MERMISNFATELGVTADTIRYYEKVGLLPQPRRTAGGYRIYGDDAREKVQFIKRAQRFGLRLDEIRELMEIRERGLCPCGHTADLLQKRVHEVEEELARLSALREELATMIEELPAGAKGVRAKSGWHCPGALIRDEAVTRIG